MNRGTTQVAETLRAFGLRAEDFDAWRESRLPADQFADWLTDRVARRPQGARAREVYGSDDVHEWARRAILGVLVLTPQDHLLEVGCGGGILLRDASATGARVTGVDHSEEMVALASEQAPAAEVRLAEAEHLPFADCTFTAAALSVVFLFFGEPIVVLRECRRVLRADGRLAVYTTAPELRGTPAAPEPLAGCVHLYTDSELAELARRAGWRNVAVRNDSGGQLLTAWS